MILIKKIIMGIKKPRIAISIIYSKVRSSYIRFRASIFNKKIKISKNVIFNQKTILSGSGAIILNDKISIGYRIGGNFHKNVSEFQARYPNSKIVIGKNVAFNNSNFIVSANKIEIGSDCRIGANVTMMDFEAHGTQPDKRNEVGKLGEIIIGNNVWIGNNVIILKNVYIGDNSIITAGSVVLKGNYQANSIIGGNPAKIIKQL